MFWLRLWTHFKNKTKILKPMLFGTNISTKYCEPEKANLIKWSRSFKIILFNSKIAFLTLSKHFSIESLHTGILEL